MRHCTQCGAATPDDARFCPRCGAPVAAIAVADPMIGKVITDRYRLVEKIGQGGSGTIYRGEHTTLRKRVAVKVLHAQLSTDDTALERFRREATTVAELDNDHILQVLDFGRTDDNRLFFAMEYLEGETLTKVIERDKQLPVTRALDILVQVAEALTEAHGLGYVHRDLRPRNVFLINRRGRTDFVKLLDFGLAKLILPNAEAKQTAMGMTFGDPRYMSPEQARGEPLDRRSDIYSLGAIAFEMLTGAPPYQGSGTFEILQQHLDAPVPRVRDRRGDCPEWLDAIVQRALAKKPDGRYATVSSLLEPLRAQQPPPAADAAEKAEHAKLSSERPQSATPAAAPAPVQSMGPSAKPAAADAPSAKPPSPRETQALTTLAPRPVPAPAASIPDKAAKNKKNEGLPAASASASGSVDVTPSTASMVPANVPSVVVESSSQEKTVPAKLPPTDASPAAFEDRPTAEKPIAAPLPAGDPSRRRADPTGEWFSSDSRPMKTIAGATYDDLDEIPKKNRGPIIIAGVAGGLFLIGMVVIAMLPKPQHQPVRGEEPKAVKTTEPEPTKVAAPAEPQAPAASSGVETQASGVASAPTSATGGGGGGGLPGSTPAFGATAHPVVASPPTSGSAQPAPVAAPAVVIVAAPPPPPKSLVTPSGATLQPSSVIAKSATPTPTVANPKLQSPPSTPAATSKPAVADKPAAKEPPAKAEKPTRIASSDKPGRTGALDRFAAAGPAAADKPAAADRRKHDKGGTPDAFKDPFSSDAPKATAPSATESAQADFFVKLGRQKLGSSDLTAAAANFNKAREYDAKSSEAIAGLGEVAFEQGDYSGAAVHLKQAVRLSPNRARYLVLLGQAYYKLGKAREAVGEYKRALRLDPNNQEAQHSLEVAERKLLSGG